MDDGPTIALAQASDLADITALLNHEIEHGYAHFGTDPEPESKTRASWEAHKDTHPWLVARGPGGAFQGFAKASQWSARGAYDWCVEITVYIHPDAQRRGVGRALYTRLFGILRDQGYITVIAGASVPNAGSDALHKSVGMRVIGEHTSIGYKFGRWYGVRYYQGFLVDEGTEPGPVRQVSEVI